MMQSYDIGMRQFVQMLDFSIDVVEFIVLYFVDFYVGLDCVAFAGLLVHSQGNDGETTLPQVRQHLVVIEDAGLTQILGYALLSQLVFFFNCSKGRSDLIYLDFRHLSHLGG